MPEPRSSRKSSIPVLLSVLAGLLAVLFLSPYFTSPPKWVERRIQRQKVVERVQSAGGWSALQQDCATIVEKYRDSAFIWRFGDSNALPPSLQALKPMQVQFYSPAIMRDFKDEPQVPVVHIKIFGMHSTGGHSTPYFGLEIMSGPGAETYKPRPKAAASGNGYSSYRQVTNGIYEIY